MQKHLCLAASCGPIDSLDHQIEKVECTIQTLTFTGAKVYTIDGGREQGGVVVNNGSFFVPLF